MKTILIKIGAVIGGFFLLIAGFFVVYFKGKSEGKEETENKQRKEVMTKIEEGRGIRDKAHSLTREELQKMWSKDKRLQDEE